MRTLRFAALVALAAMLGAAGCDVASKSQQSEPVASLTAPAIACPSQDFDAFLRAFIDDPQVQKAYTERPLRSESIDAHASPEPKQVIAMLDERSLRFPVIPGVQKQKDQGLVLSQTELNGDKEVMLAKPDTDYQMSFFFRKDECWKLYRTRDDSL